jgi:hypothetical protein
MYRSGERTAGLVKVKDNVIGVCNLAPRREDEWRRGYGLQFNAFLTCAIDGGKRSA